MIHPYQAFPRESLMEPSLRHICVPLIGLIRARKGLSALKISGSDSIK
jgi:hypothetical protein